jgi:hypothetical protein
MVFAFLSNMVFNILMQNNETTDFELEKRRSEARALIDSEGGVTALADKLDCSPQRVQNWLDRGISADAKVAHPEIFFRHLMGRKPVKAL